MHPVMEINANFHFSTPLLVQKSNVARLTTCLPTNQARLLQVAKKCCKKSRTTLYFLQQIFPTRTCNNVTCCGEDRFDSQVVKLFKSFRSNVTKQVAPQYRESTQFAAMLQNKSHVLVARFTVTSLRPLSDTDLDTGYSKRTRQYSLRALCYFLFQLEQLCQFLIEMNYKQVIIIVIIIIIIRHDE